MSTLITTELGQALPPRQRHAITFHLPKWTNLRRLIDKDPTLFQSLTSVYPRMLPAHQDVKALFGAVEKFLNVPGTKRAFIFTSPASAAECVTFVTGPQAAQGKSLAQAVKREDLSLHTLEIEQTRTKLYTLIFPCAEFSTMLVFWQNSGTGITSRLAEKCLPHLDTLREVPSTTLYEPVLPSPAHFEIKSRIASLLERAPVGGPRDVKVQEEDIYLFQSGMTSIYRVHGYLLKAHAQKSAFFGFAFHATLQIFDNFGPGYKLFGLGTNAELENLEKWLAAEKAQGRGIQAIWCEFPSNPSLTVPNLSRLREIADSYGCVLVMDDTIGSFANMDLLGPKGADILVSSLTKSFSGYADVMGGSAVLNPLGSRYVELKSLFETHHKLDYVALDAEVMASNSRDYLERSRILNSNTSKLVSFLSNLASDPNSGIVGVYHPTTNPEYLANFDAVKRPTTEDFEPGYGCLFSIDFATIEKLKAFYDNINLHVGPHLGAHRTIIIAYVIGLYSEELEWAKANGLKDTMLRIAPGLEDVNLLIKDFENALRVMNDVTQEKRGTSE